MTRARDLLLLPRLSCNVAANAWANAVDLGFPGLPAFDPTALPSSSLPPVDPDTNIQDRPTFETEAALIATLATRIVRITPSTPRHRFCGDSAKHQRRPQAVFSGLWPPAK